MAKIDRAHQKIFCDGVAAQDNISQFGSLKASLIQYSKDPATIQGLVAWTEGWKSAVVSNNAPALQDENALFYLLTRQLAYLMQAGIPEWHASTTYYLNSYCQNAGVVYRSVVNDNTGNAVTLTNYWLPVLTPSASGGAIGNVPVGALVAIGRSSAWTPPAAGEVKDGYALCNGQAFSALPPGSYHANFTYGNLPQLTDSRFLMGVAVGSIGAMGGQNSLTLADVNIPRIYNGTLPVSGTVNIGHSHNEYAGTTNRGLSGASTLGAGYHAHSVSGTTRIAGSDTGGGWITSGGSEVSTQNISYFGMSLTADAVADHSHTISGGVVDISHSHTLATTNVAVANGVTSTLTLGQSSPTALENRPLYFSALYVMRVI